MKSVQDVTACVIDYGTFSAIAEKLGETMKKVYYYSPFEREFQNVQDAIKGYGLPGVDRIDQFLDPDVFGDIDLFVFPEIGYGGLQRHLRSLGKAVWGAMGADELELSRTYFMDVLEEVGLPVVHTERIIGLSALSKYLKANKSKWVKVNRFRGNMETWHHIDYAQSEPTLDSLAVVCGGAKEQMIFVVQDEIESDMETGYDGWSIDGKFPAFSYQGYEKKNEIYLASVVSSKDLPKEIGIVNQAMAPVLEEYGYRTWWATEIRVADGVPYFIDPTPRMPGLSGEHQLETCSNFADVIWHGANGIMLQPTFAWKFAAEATLHYEATQKKDALVEEWKTLRLPKDLLPWLKLYHYCKIDGVYRFPPDKSDEVGVVLGVGDTCEESIEHLKQNLEALKDVPVHANLSGLPSLLQSIEEAEKQGIKFGGDIPDPDTILKGSENL